MIVTIDKHPICPDVVINAALFVGVVSGLVTFVNIYIIYFFMSSNLELASSDILSSSFIYARASGSFFVALKGMFLSVLIFGPTYALIYRFVPSMAKYPPLVCGLLLLCLGGITDSLSWQEIYRSGDLVWIFILVLIFHWGLRNALRRKECRAS